MNLASATAFSQMGERTPAIPEKKVKTAESLTEELFAQALDRGRPFIGMNTMQWQKKWLGSSRFHLRRIYLNRAAAPCDPRDPNHVLATIHSGKDCDPILVDVNIRGVGRTAAGFTPKAIVIDGKHRFMAANLRGEDSILAWVGEKALPIVEISAGGPGSGRHPGGGMDNMREGLASKGVAKQFGYQNVSQKGSGTQSKTMYEHPDGHKLEVFNHSGAWGHTEQVQDSGKTSNRSSGSNATDLHQHLAQVHGF